MKQLHNNSYNILRDRITVRGYAITSLTGLYVGMFPRDSSIQAMAHIGHGDYHCARKILRYLLSYHSALELERTAHIIENINDEEYGNTYLTSDLEILDGYFVSQRKDEQGIFLVNAPYNRASQSFIPLNDVIYGVEVNLSKTYDTDKVSVYICTDPKDDSTAIASVDYVFGNNPSGWQTIYFNAPVNVLSGKEYYIMIVAHEGSGRVVWNGSTKSCADHRSYNFDYACFQGWEVKHYALAFEILSVPACTVAKHFLARSEELLGVQLSIYSNISGIKATVEIKEDLRGNAVVAQQEFIIDNIGVQKYLLEFEEKLILQKGKKYFVLVTLPQNKAYCKVMTDPGRKSSTFGYDEKRRTWDRIGYNLLVDPIFDMDVTKVFDVSSGGCALQKIFTRGEKITGVKLFVSKKECTDGNIMVSLCKGYLDDLQILDTQKRDVSNLSENGGWEKFIFELPLKKTRSDGEYYIRVEGEKLNGSVYWCGSTDACLSGAYIEKDARIEKLSGSFAYEALRADFGLISNLNQADANYMLIHAWTNYVFNCDNSKEDSEFISASYPIICKFASYYLDNELYNNDLNLILNPSLEHSRLGRYWVAYDLITNVFASQSLFELSKIASALNDSDNSKKFLHYSERIKTGIYTNLVAELDGKMIYAEFYDAEHGMEFYKGISWVNLAPVAAEWYGIDHEIMKNTYEAYKKHGAVNMYGFDCPASEATIGTGDITKEMIGKCIAWEMMLCSEIGDKKRLEEIIKVELETSVRNGNNVYPECWRSEDYITDPGNQEHCAWQVYAADKVFGYHKI